MATVLRENIGLLNDKIVVTLEKNDYLPSFEKAIKEYSRKANIPGFRKGMVPPGMIKKMYGSSLLAEEVNKSVEKELLGYMQNEQLEIFAQPLPFTESQMPSIDVSQPAEYAFAFEIGLKPEFEIADLASASIKEYKLIVTDEMVNLEIGDIQSRHEIFIEQESITSIDDDLTLQFIESDAEGNELEGGIKKDSALLVKDLMPDFREQFMGKRKDDSIVLKLSEAFEENERNLVIKDLGFESGQELIADKYFKVLISKIELKERKELNENFFNEVFPGKNIVAEDDFRSEVRQAIASQWEMQTRNQIDDQIYHQLLDHTQIDFPEQFLKRWMLSSSEKEKTPEEIEKEYPAFANQLKWTLIVDKIVAANNIEVSAEDIRTHAKSQLLGYMNGSIDMNQPWIEEYLDRMIKDKKFVENTYHRIKNDKFFLWAETQITPTETSISVDDFNKMLEEHKHQH